MKRSPLLTRRPPDRRSEPGYREWHEAISGLCECCGLRGRLVRHHVLTEARVRLAGGDPWDLRNSLALGVACACHRSHHQAVARLPVSCVHADALAFTVELLGEDAAAVYLARFYRVA